MDEHHVHGEQKNSKSPNTTETGVSTGLIGFLVRMQTLPTFSTPQYTTDVTSGTWDHYFETWGYHLGFTAVLTGAYSFMRNNWTCNRIRVKIFDGFYKGHYNNYCTGMALLRNST